LTVEGHGEVAEVVKKRAECMARDKISSEFRGIFGYRFINR